METSLQLSLALAGIAATLFGVGITLIVQWSALPKKNQLRNLAFWSAIVLFILALPLLLKAIYAGWGSRDVIEVIEPVNNMNTGAQKRD